MRHRILAFAGGILLWFAFGSCHTSPVSDPLPQSACCGKPSAESARIGAAGTGPTQPPSGHSSGEASDGEDSHLKLPYLAGRLAGPSGDLGLIEFPIDFNGRPTVGDLDNDGCPDVVMACRDRVAAYRLSGDKIWDFPAATNWDYARHYF